jgi:hypothetical protein
MSDFDLVSMLTRAEALEIASGAIAHINSGKSQAIIWEEHTVKRDHVFAFLCNTKEYKESGNSRHSLFGIGPIIVSRRTGAVVVCGNRTSWSDSIDEYERRAAAGDW